MYRKKDKKASSQVSLPMKKTAEKENGSNI